MSVLAMSYQRSSRLASEIQGETEDCGASIPTNEQPINTLEKHTAQEEFVRLLYNDIVDILLTEWRNRTKTQKSGFSESSIKDNDAIIEAADASNIVEVEFPSKNNYVGRVIEKRMDGEGVYRWNSGETYKGRLEKNAIEGRGHLSWNDHSWYEGEFHKGYRHGNGNLVSLEYRRFHIGQWYMGRKHGNGYSRYNNNEDDFYEGDWKMDLKHGKGFRVYKNGARYIGQWEDGQRHGVGTMVWPNGDVYRGEWENGAMNGYGEYVWNGFLNESLSWPQENCYMGEWLNGMKHGTGVLKLNSLGGAKYSGNWYMDKKDGHGMIIGNSGGVTKGDPLFLDNILVPLQRSESAFYKEDQERLNTTSKKSAMHATQEEPRRTTVCDSLENVPVSSYVQRLLDPWSSIFNTNRSSVSDISFGKCEICQDHSSCACLHDQSRNPETRSTTVSSLDIASSSSEFCTKDADGFGNVVERSEGQYEEHWIRNCLINHMKKLREVYKTYAELYCDHKTDSDQRNLSMGRIALWQLMRDCNLHSRGFSLIQFERYTAMNKSAFIEAPFYPFERVEFFQFIHALLEVSWHLYTKLGDIETEEIRGRLAGGLHRLLVKDVFPNAGKIVGNVSTTCRDLLPLYAVHQLYCNVGEPHTARQFLRASCIVKGSTDPKPMPYLIKNTAPIRADLLNGINAVTVGEKLSYIPTERLSTLGSRSCPSEDTEKVYDDELARELFALRHLGAPKMVSVMAAICPGIKDEETDRIVNMDYELTFLEFYEILLEAAKSLIDVKKILAEEANRRATKIADAELAKFEADQILSQSQSVQSSETQSKRSTASKVPKSRRKVA